MHAQYDSAAWPPCEPCFEAPPRLAVRPERRLTAYAEAAFHLGAGGHEFRDNAVTLAQAAGGSAMVVATSRSVTRAFGLVPGPLAGPPDSLAATLSDVLARAEASAAVTPFEAAVAAPGAACLLLRGVLLPTATGADIVLSWKQVLDNDATARLRAELLRELRPTARCTALADVFA